MDLSGLIKQIVGVYENWRAKNETKFTILVLKNYVIIGAP